MRDLSMVASTWGSRLRELVLWAGAVLGLLSVGVALAVAFFGFSFLVFRSGSMAPEIPTGGLAFSQTVDAKDLEPGDVVSVIAASGERITHRVVSTTLRGDEATLVLKGDANATEDSEVYVVTSADRVVFSVPYGGYVVAHLLTPPGILGAACLALMMVLLGFASSDEDEDEDEDDGDEDEEPIPSTPRSRRHAASRRPTRQTALIGAVLVAALAGGGFAASSTDGTLAAFTDRGTAAGEFSALKMASPQIDTCRLGIFELNMTFPAVAVPGRTVTYDAVLSNGRGLTVTGTGATRSLSVSTGQAPGFLSRNRYTVIISARATATSGGGQAWISQAEYNISTAYSIMSCDGPA